MGWPGAGKTMGLGLDHCTEVVAARCALLLKVRADFLQVLVGNGFVQQRSTESGSLCVLGGTASRPMCGPHTCEASCFGHDHGTEVVAIQGVLLPEMGAKAFLRLRRSRYANEPVRTAPLRT
jgi:hypothetical protein